jgi:2-hydroxy-3-oxopropionate reductase
VVTEQKYVPAAFPVRGMMKDFDLAFAAAKQYGVSLPVTGLVRQLYAAAAASGRSEHDVAVLVQLLEEMSGYKR